jgi:hypothetical protein
MQALGRYISRGQTVSFYGQRTLRLSLPISRADPWMKPTLPVTLVVEEQGI